MHFQEPSSGSPCQPISPTQTHHLNILALALVQSRTCPHFLSPRLSSGDPPEPNPAPHSLAPLEPGSKAGGALKPNEDRMDKLGRGASWNLSLNLRVDGSMACVSPGLGLGQEMDPLGRWDLVISKKWPQRREDSGPVRKSCSWRRVRLGSPEGLRGHRAQGQRHRDSLR